MQETNPKNLSELEIENVASSVLETEINKPEVEDTVDIKAGETAKVEAVESLDPEKEKLKLQLEVFNGLLENKRRVGNNPEKNLVIKTIFKQKCLLLGEKPEEELAKLEPKKEELWQKTLEHNGYPDEEEYRKAMRKYYSMEDLVKESNQVIKDSSFLTDKQKKLLMDGDSIKLGGFFGEEFYNLDIAPMLKNGINPNEVKMKWLGNQVKVGESVPILADDFYAKIHADKLNFVNDLAQKRFEAKKKKVIDGPISDKVLENEIKKVKEEISEKLSPENKKVLLSELESKWEQANKQQINIRENKDVAVSEAEKMRLSDEIIDLADELSGRNLRKEMKGNLAEITKTVNEIYKSKKIELGLVKNKSVVVAGLEESDLNPENEAFVRKPADVEIESSEPEKTEKNKDFGIFETPENDAWNADPKPEETPETPKETINPAMAKLATGLEKRIIEMQKDLTPDEVKEIDEIWDSKNFTEKSLQKAYKLVKKIEKRIASEKSITVEPKPEETKSVEPVEQKEKDFLETVKAAGNGIEARPNKKRSPIRTYKIKEAVPPPSKFEELKRKREQRKKTKKGKSKK